MYELTVKGHFSAAHHLRQYDGSCAAVHGHNWDVEVAVRGPRLDDAGLLIDFRVLKQAVRDALAAMDHVDLNTAPELAGLNPTSEHLARFLHQRLGLTLDDERCRVWSVAVAETAGTRAVYWAEATESDD